MVRTISVADLERLNACEEQVESFRRTFLKASIGVGITVENVVKAVNAGLNLKWLARSLFTTPAYVEYKRVVVASWAEYERSTTPTRQELYRARGLSRCWADPALDPAQAAHKRALIQGRATYNRAAATAWVEAYEASVDVAGKGDE